MLEQLSRKQERQEGRVFQHSHLLLLRTTTAAATAEGGSEIKAFFHSNPPGTGLFLAPGSRSLACWKPRQLWKSEGLSEGLLQVLHSLALKPTLVENEQTPYFNNIISKNAATYLKNRFVFSPTDADIPNPYAPLTNDFWPAPPPWLAWC